MADMYVPRRRSPGRTALNFIKSALTVAVTLATIPMVIAVGMTPKCSEKATRYVVVPSDVHGKLEYCIAESHPGRYTPDGSIWRNVVQPDAICSQAKPELAQRAATMTQTSAQAKDACDTRALHATYDTFVAPVARWIHRA